MAATLNLVPVASVDITRDNNVKITGKFLTTDLSDAGRPCFMIIRKPNEVDSGGENLLTQGFGIVWRKSVKENCHNLFVVDQSLDVPEFVLDPTQKAMGHAQRQFVASAYKEILINTEYYFELTINSDNALQFRIWPVDGGSRPVTADLSYGASTPLSEGNLFGIGVLDTRGGEWKFDDIKVYGLGPEYATYIALFDGSYLPITTDIQVKGYGEGENNDMVDYGITLLIWNYTDLAWEEIGDNDAGPLSPAIEKIINVNNFKLYGEDQDDYMDPNNEQTVYLMVRSKYPSSITEDNTIQSLTAIDYIKIAGYIAPGFHAGGMADIYVRSTDMTQTEKVVDPAHKVVRLVPGQFSLPIARIERIAYLDGGGEELGELTSAQWELRISNENLRYSTREVIDLVIDDAFVGYPLKIVYSYFGKISDVQQFLDDQISAQTGLSEPGSDFLAKEFIPAYVSITVQYSGDIEASDMTNAIRNWVNSTITTQLQRSDLVSFLYAQGADYVNSTIDDFVIKVEIHEPDGTVDTTVNVADQIILSRNYRFIADDMTVTKITT